MYQEIIEAKWCISEEEQLESLISLLFRTFIISCVMPALDYFLHEYYIHQHHIITICTSMIRKSAFLSSSLISHDLYISKKREYISV